MVPIVKPVQNSHQKANAKVANLAMTQESVILPKPNAKSNYVALKKNSFAPVQIAQTIYSVIFSTLDLNQVRTKTKKSQKSLPTLMSKAMMLLNKKQFPGPVPMAG